MIDKKNVTSSAPMPGVRDPGQSQAQAHANQVRRIGIIQCISESDDAALRYFILSMNSLQTFLQFEFVPVNDQDEFLMPLLTSRVCGRPSPASMLEFYRRERQHFQHVAGAYEQLDGPPDCFTVISTASFEGNYFYTSNGLISVIAMGGWERAMAPPSILEFIQTLVLEGALVALCPELNTHLGTRGCLMDFSAVLSDARQKVLTGFICHTCESVLFRNGYSNLVVELRDLLSRRWLGSSADPASPAGIVSKLGHDLFITKGLEPSWLESARMTLAQEGIKQILVVLGTILAAVLGAASLALLGYAVVNVHVSSISPSPTTTNSANARTQSPKPAVTRTQP